MIKVVELFAGIGAPRKALQRLGIDHEVVAISEFDKFAEASYCAVYSEDTSINWGDITQIDPHKFPDFDLMTWGFPCQDISVAGKQKGIAKECASCGELYEIADAPETCWCDGEVKNTRSGLYEYGLGVLEAKRPKYSLIENVKNLIGKKHKPQFEQMLKDLEALGYNNYWKVLNAKDYGVPQNRERVFVFSVLKGHDKFEGAGFPWPEPFDSGIRLKDLLEDEVDEKYYISDEKVEKLISQIKTNDSSILRPERTEYGKQIRKQYENGEIQESRHNMTELKPRKDGISNTLTTVQKDNLLAVPCLTPDRVEKRQNGRRFKEDGEPMFTLTSQDRHGVLVIDDTQGFDGVRTYEDESPCLRSQRSGLKIVENKINQIGNIVETDSFGGNPQCGRIYGTDGISPTLNTCGGGQREPKVLTQYRIRKLTPKECWRLMGFDDADFEKAEKVCSNSQLYKQAGNSIVVDVLEHIFKAAFSEYITEGDDFLD